jgi:hypothetical protein
MIKMIIKNVIESIKKNKAAAVLAIGLTACIAVNVIRFKGVVEENKLNDISEEMDDDNEENK